MTKVYQIKTFQNASDYKPNHSILMYVFQFNLKKKRKKENKTFYKKKVIFDFFCRHTIIG